MCLNNSEDMSRERRLNMKLRELIDLIDCDEIVLDASCCAGSTPEKHRMALEVMKSCQVDIVNEENGDQVDVIGEV